MLSNIENKILRKKPGDVGFRVSLKSPRCGRDQRLAGFNRFSSVETKSCYSWLVLYFHGAMNEKLYQICDEIEKIKEFQDVVKSKFTKLELTNTIPVQPVELNTFNEVDMTPRQPDGMDTANKRVATFSQRQHCDLKGAGSKGDCFVFDLFKNRISQLQKEISKKTR